MKKLMILFFSLLALQTTVKADNDKIIQFAQLPQQSQQLIKNSFGSTSIALIKMEDDFFDKSYEVIFSNGNKVEFNKNGQWKEIDCKYTEVPSKNVPTQISNYVSKNYPNVKILKIEKGTRSRHEVELGNGLELKFDSSFNLVDIEN